MFCQLLEFEVVGVVDALLHEASNQGVFSWVGVVVVIGVGRGVGVLAIVEGPDSKRRLLIV